MGSVVTASHVKQLASRPDECVLVPLPETGELGVIGVLDPRYKGAHTVVATSAQVDGRRLFSDYNADGQLTEKAADRIADQIRYAGVHEARDSARAMKCPEGYDEMAALLADREDEGGA